VSGADHRTVGELLADSDELARETLLDATPDHASAMVRSFRASINVPWLIPGTRTCGGEDDPRLADLPAARAHIEYVVSATRHSALS
jgi:hypothetical protein